MRSVLRVSILLASTAFAIPACRATSTGAERPWNVVVLMADDIGAECFDLWGGESYRTPNIDRLAREGVRFTNAYSQPLCTPSPIKIMTGQSNVRNYVRFGIMDPDERTFAHLLRDAGYATGVVGKWQLYGAEHYGELVGKGMHPREAGFDEYCLWQVERLGSRYAGPVLEIKSLEIDGEVQERAEQEYGPDLCADWAVDFFARHRAEPFLLYYPMILVHSPFEPTPLSTRRDREDPTGYFGDMVTYMDHIVGRLLDGLEEQGLRDRTLFVFTSDNGTGRNITSRFRGREFRGAKGLTTDGGTHVPLVASIGRAGVANEVCPDLIDLADVLPTLLDAAGVEAPGDWPLDGRSFLPQLLGQPGDPRDVLTCFFHPRPDEGSGGAERRWARDARFKLYGTGELFDVVRDPLEETPVVEGNPDAERARARLRAALAEMQETPGKILAPRPGDD